jgi:hypothetical protein
MGLVFLLTLVVSLPALGDSLTFTGGAPGTNGYFALIASGSGAFDLVAPISSLAVGSGGNYSQSAVLALQTGASVGSPGPLSLAYNSGSFALYSLADWNFGTESGTNPLLIGSLGTGVAQYLQPVSGSNPQLYATAFLGQVTGGTLLGSFGGYNLAAKNPVGGGGVASISIDLTVLNAGLLSVPVQTEMAITTPEPSTLILLSSGTLLMFFRRRR